MIPAEFHTLTGAYVLDALDTAQERAAVENHLGHCASCAHEVRELSETAARLGLAVSAPVPPALRAEVLRRVRTVRQEPPATAAPGGGSPGRLRSRALPRWALAACLAAAASFGAPAAWQYDRAEAGSTAVAAVLAAPDARVESSRCGCGGPRARACSCSG